jgi:hypothetical protein
MITMTINELMTVIPALRELTTKPFKGATSFKIARLIRELDKENVLFEEARAKLIETYGLRDENQQLMINEDGSIKIQEDKIEACNLEIISLLSASIEINAEKIPIEAFNDIELSPIQAAAVDILIDY